MFLIDKYSVNNYINIFFHQNVYKNLIIGYNLENCKYNLKKLDFYIKKNKIYKLLNFKFIKNKIFNEYKTIPNLLIQGNKGIGKHTLINYLLKDIYGDKVFDLFYDSYSILGYNGQKINISIQKSNYHIIIDASNSSIDKYIIQNIVKEYAKTEIINNNNIPFKIIFINNIDNLNYYAQTALRRTMEIYHKNCKFILCSENISKIIDPIKSRCLNIIIPAPSFNELKLFIIHIFILENINIKKKYIKKIINAFDGDIKKLLWNIELLSININDLKLNWYSLLNIISKTIYVIKNKQKTHINNKLIKDTRNNIYNIYMTNIHYNSILYEILKIIIFKNNLDFKLINQILQSIINLEPRLIKNKRPIIHLETIIYNIYLLVYNFYENISL